MPLAACARRSWRAAASRFWRGAAQRLAAYLDVFTSHYLLAKQQLPVDWGSAAHQRLSGLKTNGYMHEQLWKYERINWNLPPIDSVCGNHCLTIYL